MQLGAYATQQALQTIAFQQNLNQIGHEFPDVFNNQTRANWVRRCAESWQDGRFVLAQETNAYAVLPSTQWQGYRPPAEPPAPAPGTWGEPTPMPTVLAQAALEGRHSGDLRTVVGILDADPKDRLAAALARLGRAFMARDS